MFTIENTEGFSPSDLTLLNEALDVLVARGYDEKSASDLVNDRWVEGATLETLTK